MSIAPENIPAMTGPQIPDAQPRSLRQVLEEALNLMFADRVLSPDEQQDIGWFFQSVQMKVMEQQQNGVANASAMNRQQFQPQQQPGGGSVEDYGTGAGTPIEQM